MLRKLRRSTRVLSAAGVSATACAALVLAASPASANPRAYVALGGFDPSQTPTGIAIFDVATGARVGTIALSTKAFSIAINPAGTRAYVADGNGVEVVNLKTNAVVKTIPGVGGTVAVDPTGTRVYVTHESTNKLDVIDAGTNAVTKSIPVGSQPRGLVVNPAGTRAYTGNTLSAPYTISVVDLATDVHTDVSSTKLDRPENLGISPDGSNVYAANFGVGSGGTSVAILSTGTNSVGSVTVGSTPSGVMVNPTGTTAYVVNRDSMSLSLIDTASSTNVGTLPVGFSPTNIAIAPDGTRAFLTGGTDTVNAYAVVDLVHGKVVIGPKPLDGAGAVAIAPAEQPVPAVKVRAGLSKEKTSFDASGSSGGPVVRYDWRFGDGKSASRERPTITHAYRTAGSYKARLTETDGCAPGAVFGPLGVAFNGNSAFCNGSRTAVKTLTVRVPKAAVAVTRTRRAKVRRNRLAHLRVACVKELPCTGRVSLRSVGHKRMKLGSGKFKRIPARKRRTVKVKLSRAAVAFLRSRGTVKATAKATAKNRGGIQRSRVTRIKLTFAGG